MTGDGQQDRHRVASDRIADAARHVAAVLAQIGERAVEQLTGRQLALQRIERAIQVGADLLRARSSCSGSRLAPGRSDVAFIRFSSQALRRRCARRRACGRFRGAAAAASSCAPAQQHSADGGDRDADDERREPRLHRPWRAPRMTAAAAPAIRPAASPRRRSARRRRPWRASSMSDSSAFASATSLRNSAVRSPNRRLSNPAVDSRSSERPCALKRHVDVGARRSCGAHRDLGAASTTSSVSVGASSMRFVDFLVSGRRAIRAEAFTNRASAKPASDAAGDEQTGIAARERARVVDEIVDAAFAQPCRKIADGAGEPVGERRRAWARSR